MNGYKNIEERLVCFEMQAVSEFFHSWAKPEYLKEKPGLTKERLEIFRKDILGSEYSLNREKVPHELIQDEFKLCRDAIRQVRTASRKQKINRKWLVNFQVVYEFKTNNGTVEIHKPFPAPISYENRGETLDYPDTLMTLIPKGTTPTDLAYEIVGIRFGVGHDNVRRQCRLVPRLTKPTSELWRLLATLFLELNSVEDRINQAWALDCLLASGYSLFKLYYLVQISHSIKRQISLSKWTQDMIDKLCCTVRPLKPPGPFSQLLTNK